MLSIAKYLKQKTIFPYAWDHLLRWFLPSFLQLFFFQYVRHIDRLRQLIFSLYQYFDTVDLLVSVHKPYYSKNRYITSKLHT